MVLYALFSFGMLFWLLLSFDTYVETLFWWSPRLTSRELVSIGWIDVDAATWVTVAFLSGMPFILYCLKKVWERRGA